MAGKPVLSLSARRKDAPRGSRSMVKLAGAWEGRFPGSYDVKLDGVKEIVMADGTVITGADYWLSIKDWRESDGQRSGGGGNRGSDSQSEALAPVGDGSDIPF